MKYESNECCDCATESYPCLGSGCPNRHVVRYECDQCHTDDIDAEDIVEVDGEHICTECYEKMQKEAERETVYELVTELVMMDRRYYEILDELEKFDVSLCIKTPGCHIANGIDTLADILDKDLVTETRVSEDYPIEKHFVEQGMKFFEIFHGEEN